MLRIKIEVHSSEGLKELLTKLQKLIGCADDKELKPDDKVDALKKSEAKDSVIWFKGLASKLPSATKIAVELNKIIPEITKLFGF